ncbi:MAG: thiamine phosphate synthase [Phycisphaeraceae bacterium]|nr:MAG: thiamine phosphate synthase [Phycisphaeraceae bacterium]
MRSEARIIDANRNRAGEGLRVLEDIARFALDDEALTARCKRARHELGEAVAVLPLPAGLGLSARDTPGDVGTSVRTEREYERSDPTSVAAAACGRVGEALRSIEEIAKCVRGDAARFEALRYEAYEVGRLVSAGLAPIAPQWRLCVLLTASLCPGGDWERVARAAIAGGADCLQLREKELSDRELISRARRFVEIARESPRRIWVIINDRPDIALLCGADGVHVGQGDLSPADVRAVAGRGMLVGVSTSSVESARAANAAGASSVGLGPMFPSTTKPKDVIAGVDYLRAYLAEPDLASLPHLCIGGITPENAGELIDAGARGLAVSSAVCGAEDPEGVCAELVGSVEQSVS